jgi:hypothetical protein
MMPNQEIYAPPNGNIKTGFSDEEGLAYEDHLALADTSPELPVPEPEKKERRGCGGLSYRFLALLVLPFLGLVIAGSVLLAKRNNDDDSSAGPSSPEENENIFTPVPDDDEKEVEDPPAFSPITVAPSRLDVLSELLQPVTGTTELSDNSTPQNAALVWLADQDPAVLDLDNESFETIAQRYVSAVLYFSGDGTDWRVDNGFLSASSICEWNDGGEGGAFEGIMCDEEGAIIELIFGMLP